MFKKILIANRGEILPGTGSGTAQRWRGRLKPVSSCQFGGQPHPAPPSVLRTATSPFRGGFLLRDFVPSRESKFLLFLAALTFAFLMVTGASASTLSAKGKRELRRIEVRERASADIVMIGRWAGANEDEACDAQDRCNGTILAVSVKRGKRSEEYSISYIADIDLFRGTNRPPNPGDCAQFYLKRNRDSNPTTFAIIQYRNFEKEATQCSKKSS
jgi:hypothetical protein